jgi:hypothetical protein
MIFARFSILYIVVMIIATILTNGFEGYDSSSPFMLSIGFPMGICILYIWGWAIYQWAQYQFKYKIFKYIWFILIFFMSFVGSILFHILICERKHFLEKKQK